MTIKEVYSHFKINQGLQLHMLRVGAVAKTISDNYGSDIDTQNIVSACLMHDLGNILKFKFDNDDFNSFLEPEGVDFWRKRKVEVELEYGVNEDEVTIKMINELKVDPEISRVVEAGHLEVIGRLIEEKDFSGQVMLYCDMRVGPMSIISLDERLDDIQERYAPHRFSHEKLDFLRKHLGKIEDNIFAQSNIKPSDITEDSTLELQKELLNWEV